MISEYLNAAMHHANYEYLPNDKVYYGEIEGFQGLYATAKSLEICRDELLSTLEDWILFSIHKNLDLPTIDNINLQIKDLADA